MGNLISCRECGSQVAKSAKTCPKCGLKRPHKSRRNLIVGIIVIWGGSYLYLLSNDASRDETARVAALTPEQRAEERQKEAENSLYTRRKITAFAEAKEAILKQLKAPSTAEFGSVLDTKIGKLADSGPNTFVVQGYVDAQNGFGAQIRQDYQVIMEFEERRHDSMRLIAVDLL